MVLLLAPEGLHLLLQLLLPLLLGLALPLQLPDLGLSVTGGYWPLSLLAVRQLQVVIAFSCPSQAVTGRYRF